jgi:two-component system, cell cycle sensor histidine kinase PleC
VRRRFGRHWFKKDSLIVGVLGPFRHRRDAAEVERGAAGRQGRGGARLQGQVRVHRQYEPRAAHPAQRRHRLLGDAAVKASNDPDRVREYAGYINEAAEHLLALISSILDVSKIQAGKLQVERAHIDPDPIVRSCLLITEIKAKEKGISVSASLPEGPLSVYADPLRLKQVLINLMSNAVKFTPDNGKVTISLSPHPDGMMRSRSPTTASA